MPTNATALLPIWKAAIAVDKSVATLRRWVKLKKIAHYKIGGEIRFDPADIAAMIAAGRRLPIAA
jgi:hypothetical protein